MGPGSPETSLRKLRHSDSLGMPGTPPTYLVTRRPWAKSCLDFPSLPLVQPPILFRYFTPFGQEQNKERFQSLPETRLKREGKVSTAQGHERSQLLLEIPLPSYLSITQTFQQSTLRSPPLLSHRFQSASRSILNRRKTNAHHLEVWRELESYTISCPRL